MRVANPLKHDISEQSSRVKTRNIIRPVSLCIYSQRYHKSFSLFRGPSSIPKASNMSTMVSPTSSYTNKRKMDQPGTLSLQSLSPYPSLHTTTSQTRSPVPAPPRGMRSRTSSWEGDAPAVHSNLMGTHKRRDPMMVYEIVQMLGEGSMVRLQRRKMRSVPLSCLMVVHLACILTKLLLVIMFVFHFILFSGTSC